MNLKKTLPFFSYVFHPMFIPVYAAFFYFFLNDSYYSTPEKYIAVFQIVIITILLPILFFFVLRSLGQLDSIMISEISQRKIPLVLLCFLTFLLVRKSITLDRFPELHFFFGGGLLSTVLALGMLFFRTKASLHLLAISALTLFVIGLSIHNQSRNINWIAFLVFIIGVVASSRLEMQAHTTKELVIGFLLGSIPQLIFFYFWL